MIINSDMLRFINTAGQIRCCILTRVYVYHTLRFTQLFNYIIMLRLIHTIWDQLSRFPRPSLVSFLLSDKQDTLERLAEC